MSGKPGQKSDKPVSLPDRFSEQFLEGMDGRSRIAKELRSRLDDLMQDLGGELSLSYQRRSLAKRAVFLEATIEGREAALARGDDVDLGPLIQGVNSLIGLYRVLGLNRRSREVSLNEYLEKNS